MKLPRFLLLVAPLCWGLAWGAGGLGRPQAAAASDQRLTATVKAIRQARGSIVNIHGQKTVAAPDDNPRRDAPQHVNGMGTGVIIDQRGYIITNYHVVEGVKKIQVTLFGGQSFVATQVSHDPRTDLAIIKISSKEEMPVINIGTSGNLMEGEQVIAIGNAYGYEHTVTRGIVSALHRTVHVSDTQQYQDLIQTDASINPGNSGGPLLNIDGEMIGINVAVRAGAQGIGFAIPVDMAMEIAARLMSVERIDGIVHGVKPSKETAGSHELIVGELADSSPAAKCGLLPGDVITKADDHTIARTLDLERALLEHHPGDEVALTVRRNDQPLTLNLVLAPKARSSAGWEAVSDPATSKNRVTEQIWETLGLRMEPAKQFRQTTTKYRGGMTVLAVRPDSPASRQGISRGDILVGMHIYETLKLQDVAYILNLPNFSDLEPLKFIILRDSEPLFGHVQISMRSK